MLTFTDGNWTHTFRVDPDASGMLNVYMESVEAAPEPAEGEKKQPDRVYRAGVSVFRSKVEGVADEKQPLSIEVHGAAKCVVAVVAQMQVCREVGEAEFAKLRGWLYPVAEDLLAQVA